MENQIFIVEKTLELLFKKKYVIVGNLEGEISNSNLYVLKDDMKYKVESMEYVKLKNENFLGLVFDYTKSADLESFNSLKKGDILMLKAESKD